ncbi:MAG: RluA family pseudouridine synthase [Armatimonadetes bacterium]|nr:RluA family pseudouridine synthase [Armatimonadota bacterium]
MNETTREFVVENGGGERLDIFLADRIESLSRSTIRKLIDSNHVLVNSSPSRASYKVALGDRIRVTIPPPEPPDILPEEIALDVVYEDDHIIVVNKPKGMTVHPAPGSRHGTLVNAILAHSKSLSGVGGVERPGIVHRLDKDTSGLLVVAKTNQAHASLQEQLQKRTAERKYIALVWGETKFNQAVVDAPIGRHPTDRQRMAVIKDTVRYTARDAITNLTVRERFVGFTLLEAKLDTGRTHQIRVHCAFIGHPVVGDPTYGGTTRSIPASYDKQGRRELEVLIERLQGQALHAYSLAFDHPVIAERLSFEVPVPGDMKALLDWLREHSAR